MTINLSEPRTVVRRDRDRLRIRFQDPATNAELVTIDYPLEFAATLAAEFESIAPPEAKPEVFTLDGGRLS